MDAPICFVFPRFSLHRNQTELCDVFFPLASDPDADAARQPRTSCHENFIRWREITHFLPHFGPEAM
jgi:hypothetical protein